MAARRFLSALFILLFAAGSLTAQGLYYESTFEGGPMMGGPMVSKTIIMPKMMKYISGQDNDFMVMRMDKEKLYQIDTKEKSYWEMTFAEFEATMKKASAKMDKQMVEMEEHMKNLPEEQRKMMEQMMGGKMGKKGPEAKVTKTSETKKIGGYTCTKYIVKEGERVLVTVWTTKDVKAFDAIRKDYEAFSQRMVSMNPGFMKGLTDAMFKIEGFPMETDFGQMKSTVTKVEQRSFSESEFTVPAGYTKKEPPLDEMMGGPEEN